MRTRVMEGLSAAATATSLAHAGYVGLLTFTACFAPATPPPPGRCATRFAILVSAYDEARLIAETVTTMGRLDYPCDKVVLHVVADHCNDATAELAREAGAVVHEHLDPHPRGKGPALSWAFDRIEPEVDVVVIVDADTLVDSQLLRSLDAYFAAGAAVVQANYSVRTPEASSTIALRFAALAVRHHLRSLGRVGIGASSGLFGNGMAVRRDLLEKMSVSSHLTEDLELGCRLVLDGVPIDYAPQAVLEAEMPETLSGSETQHERWERGRIDVARRFVMPLARSAFGRGAPRRRARIDAAVDLLVPPLSVTVIGSSATMALAVTGLVRRRTPFRLVNAALATVSAAVVVVHVFAALRLVGAPRVVYRSLAGAPHAMVWKVTLWARMLLGHDEVSWSRTERNASPD